MEKAPEAHRSFVVGLLKELAALGATERKVPCEPARRELFLGLESESWFWELVGVRLVGHPAFVLGLMQFRRQKSESQPLGRTSLAQYLTASSYSGNIREVAPSERNVAMIPVPAAAQVPEFLAEVRAGAEYPSVWLDRTLIQFAFDFRLCNPSDRKTAPTDGEEEGRLTRIRTAAGHLLEARTWGLRTKLHWDRMFVPMVRPVQLLADRRLALPTIVVNRSFMLAELEWRESAADAESGQEPVPQPRTARQLSTLFLPEHASATPLLR